MMICEKSAKRFCNGDITKIENYEKAITDSKTWSIHHRLETHFSDGTERPMNARISQAELKALDMYYSRPPEELIFLTSADHTYLHHKGIIRSNEYRRKQSISHKNISEETRRKMSEARKGKPAWNKGKKCPQLSEAKRGHKVSDETKQKIRETLKKRYSRVETS